MSSVLKYFYIPFLILSILLNNKVFCGKPTKNGKINLVVIDAGHGGHDPGATGLKSKEKDIVLDLALKLGKMITDNFSDVKVIYTRDKDEFIELYQRAKIANENHADLFISLHINAATNKNASGFATYVMGLNKSQANLEVAKKENSAILLEKDYKNNYDGFDPNSPEANIIFSLYQNAYLDQSLELAAKIQKHFMKKIIAKDRGVSQAGFLVLYKTAMPAILVESGFISNPEEEEMINSEKGKKSIVRSIFEAFKEYKFRTEGFNNQAQTYSPKSGVSENKINEIEKTEKKQEIKDTITNQATNTSKQIITFRVQFATSAVEKIIEDKELISLGIIKSYFHNGLYKYTVGNENDLITANKLMQEVQNKGYKDAFVVAFLNDNRINPSEALKILNQKK